jgi:hypothetical protein
MDLRAKSITNRIRWGDSSHLHALMFSFAGESNVVIESEELTGDLHYSEGDPTLHFWDIGTGPAPKSRSSKTSEPLDMM